MMRNQAISNEIYFGVFLSICSSIFIGSSFIIKKISLIKLNKTGSIRAGAGGFGYLKDWIWWLGLITMGIGELMNFVAYAFAPASLVTPLGALSVIISAILASKFLDEGLNNLGKLGCFLCILGSIVIVIHSPKENQIETMPDLMNKVQETNFINYVLIIVTISLIIIFYIGPRYGNRFVLVYLTICSTIGSLTVMSCKALGLAIKNSFYNENTSIFVILLAIVVVCIFVQMNYLNKALDLFNTSIVTPVYYVMFTSLVIVASAILFHEWACLSGEDILGGVSGFLVVISAIYLLQAYKDLDIDCGVSIVKENQNSNKNLLC